MSFLGVTFSNRRVTPSDDAMLMQAILKDGILYGCSMDYAGFTLTMAAGSLLIGGREIQHNTADSWAIGATSGFARLIITIDLSKTSTADTFNQVVTAIEYASTADGFPALEQEDINVSGTKYQIEACVVSLGTGGITAIVRKLSAVKLRMWDGGIILTPGVDYGPDLPANPEEGRLFFEVI